MSAAKHKKPDTSVSTAPRGGIPSDRSEQMIHPTKNDLIIYTDEDGSPWAAFVWGVADPAAVTALITADVIERETGYDIAENSVDCSWPPRVQTYHLRRLGDHEDEMYEICDAAVAGAQIVTGHRFYPQG